MPALLVAAGVALAAGIGSADWLATGRFEYTDRPYDATGFIGTAAAPVREADVHVFDLQSGLALASGATDPNGDFSIAVADAQTRNVGVRVLASTTETPSLSFAVADNKSAYAVYAYHDASTDRNGHGPDADVDFGTMTMPPSIGDVLSTDWSSQVFNLFDMGLLMSDWIAAVDGARPTSFVTLVFNPTTGRAASSYSGNTDRLFVADDDGYDDPNVLHELGHYVEDEYGASRSPAGLHTIGDDDQDPRLAWSEGLSTFLSSAALELADRPRPDLYSDRDSFAPAGGGGFAFTVEASAIGGATSEVAVAGALWDMVDAASSPDVTQGVDDDAIAGSDAGIWQVIEAFRASPPPATSFEDFWDSWRSLALPLGPDLEALFAAHSIDFLPDGQEPNDTPSTASPLVVDATWQENTFYDSGPTAGGDEDWFRFTASADAYYRIEIGGVADTIFGRPDPEMFLFDPDDLLLARSDDPRDLIPNDTSSSTAQDMFETVPTILFRAQIGGEYGIYVRHRSAALNLGGRYGTYPIRVVSVPAPSPSIDLVAAQRMRPGERYPMLVHGTDFVVGATLSLLDPEVVVESLEWLAPTTLYVEVSVGFGATLGDHSVIVTNPGGASAIEVDAFEVSAAAQPPIAISEVLIDSRQVEIHNRGQTTADLTGWQIEGKRAGSLSNEATFTFPPFSLAPGARVVVHDVSGSDTATELYDASFEFNWTWLGGEGGRVSLIDDGGRNVDFLRFVDSYVDDHEAPVGSGGAWMQPETFVPPAGLSLVRSDVGARFRTSHGLAAAETTMPVGAAGRENRADAWEDNDDPRLAVPLSRQGLLADLAIHPRPGGADEDWFGVVLAAGEEVTIEAEFSHGLGNLDLEVYAPGDEPGNGALPILSASSVSDDEVAAISSALTSLHGDGLYRMRIFGVTGATNDYALRRSVPEVCGDGLVTGGETCDDGNLLPGDCCSPSCTIEAAGTTCRVAAGPCDLVEACNGVTAVCPADQKSTAVCRAAGGACDLAESCDGVSDTCPTDGVVTAGVSCRPAAGICDVEELCDGVDPACPLDLKSTAECRPATDVCDLAELCDGASDDCPGDAYAPDTTVCRSAVGPCDVEELCTGSSETCPADQDLDGQSCSDGDLCNGEEICLGTTCEVGTALDCDDLDACTADSCDAVLGCRNEPIPGCTAVPVGGAFLRLALALMLLAGGALAIDRRS